VLHQGRSNEETLGLLAPLWDWLTTSRRGLVQADGEGFYDQGELILEAPADLARILQTAPSA
jgi:hypothetical protein